MAKQTIKTVFQVRRATTAEWEQYKTVVPAAGEPCFDLDLNTLKIGDGVKTYEELEPIGSAKVEVVADEVSIVLEDNIFKLAGFEAAATGAQPRKNADGNLEWVVPSTETVDGLQATVAGLQSDVTNLQTTVTTIQEIVSPSGEGATPLLSRVETLETKMDGTGEGTVDAKIDAKINEFAARVSDDGTVNTIQELINYVATHGSEVATITADISKLQGLVGTEPVKTQIDTAIANSGHMSKTEAEDTLLSKVQAAATLEHVRYEITSKPAGTLVDYREKEIRVMCPVDTQFGLQNSGANADANAYYIGIKAYAPAGAVGFKEDDKYTIEDDTMHYFEGEFAGIDVYGRKYSIIWLPVAAYDASSATWNYYGANSSKGKYIGWYYSVEWYGADGKVIESDRIRINLANEACYNSIEPFYMGSVVQEIAVNGTVMELINGRVDIAVKEYKASDEIVIAEDGTLSVGVVDVSKLVQTGELVLDGGDATGK